MKRFQLPLRPVSILRAFKELRAREQFVSAVKTAAKAEARLAIVRADVEALEGALLASRREGTRAPSEAAFFEAYRGECATELTAEREAQSAREAVQSCREHYVEAHRALRVIELVQENARAAHRREMARLEQAALDEFAGRRAAARAPAFT